MSRRQLLKGGVLGAAGTLVGAGAGVAVSGCAAESGGGPGAPLPPGSLTTDGLVDGIGVAPDDVFFAWLLGDGRRGAVQSAYRIVVSKLPALSAGAASGSETASSGSSGSSGSGSSGSSGSGSSGSSGVGGGTTVWDSGRVESAQQAFVPYGGPALDSQTVYQWTVQTWDASGRASRLSEPQIFETTIQQRDWRAKWIIRASGAGGASRPDLYTYARKEVTLGNSRIVRARAYVAADQQYELRVNGSRAGRGQAYCYPDSQYFETLDITDLLHTGARNAFALLTTWQGATKGHPAGQPAVILQASVLHSDGTRELVTTDGSWRTLPGAWLPGTQRDLEGDIVDFTENVDGPSIPAGWDSPGFDDAAWAPAALVTPAGARPSASLVAVRTRIVEEPVNPISLTTLGSGAVVADFGKVYAAVPTVSFRQGVAGRTITMRAGYLLDEAVAGQPGAQNGQVSTSRGTQHTDMSYSYVQRGGSEQFNPFDYLGFRYFQLDDPGESLASDQVVALTRHAAVPDEHAASFSSSNPTVDAIFELGRHSALFTAQEQFIDTPTREKGPWLWDGFNESQAAMASLGEQNLTRKSLLEFAQSQHRYWPNGAVNKIYPTGLGALDINEFTEIYPEWVWQYWMHTGDHALLDVVYPVLVRLASYVDRSIESSSGLVSNLPATNIYYSFPIVTRLNILGANVFRRTAEIALVLDRPKSEVNLQQTRQVRLVGAINRQLTRSDGIYVDGLNADGTQVTQTSQDTNACAVVYGVAPSGRLGAIGSYIASLGMQAPPRTATEVLEALGLSGHQDDLLRILTDPTIDGWARTLALGGTFTWEVWEPSDANGDSMSHGWGSTVLVAIQRWLLGARANEPGFASFEISPPPAALSSVNGTVPTVRGPLRVGWQRPTEAHGSFDLDLSVPPNCSAAVLLPAIDAVEVTESGQPLARVAGVRLRQVTGGVASLEVGAGEFRFSSVLGG